MKMQKDNQGVFLKVFESRFGLASFYLISAALLTFALGFIISLIIGNKSTEGVLRASTAMFWFFFAGTVASAILLLITKIPINLTFGFGNGLYYGTVASAWLLKELYSIESIIGCKIGFVLTALVCYIVWLKKYKTNTDN